MAGSINDQATTLLLDVEHLINKAVEQKKVNEQWFLDFLD